MMTTSVCIAFAAIVAGGAISYVLADKPPRSGGKPLVLEFEVRVPDSVALPAPINDKGFYPSIFETPDAHWYTHINFRNVVRSGSDIIIGGYARLRSSRATERSILIGFGETARRWQRVYLPLPGHPEVQDDWSDWIQAKEDFRREEVPIDEQMALRYRVQVGDERELVDDPF